MNRYSRGCLRLLGACSVLLFIFWAVLPTVRMAWERSEIDHLLTNAESIELVYYNQNWESKPIVYADKQLPKSEFADVMSAFPLFPDVGAGDASNCIFDPHHKIVITNRWGDQTIIRVCFECDHVKIGGEESFATPYAWRGPLRKYFAAEGMANDPQRYRKDLNPSKHDDTSH